MIGTLTGFGARRNNGFVNSFDLTRGARRGVPREDCLPGRDGEFFGKWLGFAKAGQLTGKGVHIFGIGEQAVFSSEIAPGIPPRREASTGRPEAMASRIVIGRPSKSEGRMKTSSAR